MADDESGGIGLGPAVPRMPRDGGNLPNHDIPDDIDPALLRSALEQLRSEQNLPGGVLAGLLAAGAAAAAWAGITVLTDDASHWLAVGVGFVVGVTVRYVGKGIEPVFGVAGASLALLGCAAGNLLAACVILAGEEGVALGDVLSRLDAAAVAELMATTFRPIHLVYYFFAATGGYKLSFRRLGPADFRTPVPP